MILLGVGCTTKFSNPIATISAKNVIVIAGAVRTPGPFTFEPGLSVSKALTQAGYTWSRRIRVIRMKKTILDVDPTGVDADRVLGSFMLQPGDVITVGQVQL